MTHAAWTPESHRRVSQMLMFLWPNQVPGWGREAMAGYVSVIEDAGIRPDDAIVALKSFATEFPPNPMKVVEVALTDPNVPTFEECYAQLYGPGGILGFKRAGVVLHPVVVKFAQTFGVERLKLLPVDDPEWGGVKRRELQDAYEQFLKTRAQRAVTEAARSGELKPLDPFKALPNDVGPSY